MDLSPAAQVLFEALKGWRRRIAQAQGVPPYVIFHDKTLIDIALIRPRDLAELAGCNGVGQSKLEHYGAAVLALVAETAAAA
jgi:ATP-dependent DNA helicase RecQ